MQSTLDILSKEINKIRQSQKSVNAKECLEAINNRIDTICRSLEDLPTDNSQYIEGLDTAKRIVFEEFSNYFKEGIE